MIEKGVIWDLDGVLADTTEAHFRAWVTALAQQEIPLDRPAFERVLGMNNRDILTQLMGRPPEPKEMEIIAGHKEEIFRMEAQWLIHPVPGALPLLAELDGAGWLQAVASSAPRANIDLILSVLGVRDRFRVILSGDDMVIGKPDPALFLKAAEALGLPPARCVVVEDSPFGVEAAKRAGMPCIAVTTTRPREILTAVMSSGEIYDDLTHVTVVILSSLIDTAA